MQLTDTVKFLQKAALIHQGKVLILKRSDQSESRPRAWDLPGGNAEWPKLTEPASGVHRADITREILEETGWSIDPAVFTDENLVHFTTYFDPGKSHYAFICGWRVMTPAGFDPSTLKLSAEHTAHAWISLSELDKYDFIEPAGNFIKTIIQNAFQKV